ncbi:MAG: glutaredoxin family protein [Bacteroidales bacterium]|nr:glutaredoxin family protein [Bacteroidales bacterium]
MKVTVYSTSTCPWCTRLKDWLKENKIEFEEIDVSIDLDSARRMVEKTGQMGIPVTEIDNQFVTGFDINKLKELLKI